MKIYNKLGLFAAASLMMTSCAVNDPFADKMEMGEVVPTVSWELSSTVCKAGGDAGFLGKYYTTEEGVTIDHSEVWGMILKTESAAATQKMIPSPAYTMTATVTDTVRGFHKLQDFPHSMATLFGTEYQLSASFPTSRTLGPVNWVTPEKWDGDMFNSYYPSTFKADFCEHMVTELTKDSTYLDGVRNVYLAYDFTKEQIDAVNAKYPELTPIPFPASETEVKDDLWFGVVTTDTVGYYYTTLEGDITIEHEIATKEDAPADIDPAKIYPVFKSPHWIYSRYSDNTGGAVSAIRAEYMPLWKELIEMVPFESWIYDSAGPNYAVEFSRKYSMEVQFRVIDSKGGVGKDTDVKTIELN